MVSFLCAGIPLSSFDARTVMPQLLTQVMRSDRESGRLQIGTVAGFVPE
jgi:hypothetical protein